MKVASLINIVDLGSLATVADNIHMLLPGRWEVTSLGKILARLRILHFFWCILIAS